MPKRLPTHSSSVAVRETKTENEAEAMELSKAEAEGEAGWAATCQSCGQHKSVAELRRTEEQLGR